MNCKPTLIYLHPGLSPFIKKDLDILSPHFNLIEFEFFISNKFLIFILFVKQLIVLFKNFRKTKLIICRFAGFHSFLPALFGKVFNIPAIIIPGGTECHFFPSIGYGNKTHFWYGSATESSLKWATHIAPVHHSLIEHDYTYDKLMPLKQGIRNIFPSVNTSVEAIPNGYDFEKFKNLNLLRKKNSFLTISANLKKYNFPLKGIDLILVVAPKLPDYQFTIIGDVDLELIKPVPHNITLFPALPHGELLKIYNEHEFYLQLSIAEGFPNSLCESMLCGCVPIGSNVFSIPEIIDDSGFVLQQRNADELCLLLQRVVNSDIKTLSEKARDRIIQNYSLFEREKRLLAICMKLSQNTENRN